MANGWPRQVPHLLGSRPDQADTAVGTALVVSATNKGKFVARLAAPSTVGHGWSGSVVELDGSVADDADQKRHLDNFYAELAKRNFPASATSFAKVVTACLDRMRLLSAQAAISSMPARK